jgi:hypothetical protein
MKKKRSHDEESLARKKISELLKMRQQIDELLLKFKANISEAEMQVTRDQERKSSLDVVSVDSKTGAFNLVEVKSLRPKPRAGSRPVRLQVLDCLEDLKWMAYAREIAQYSAARYGREITPTRFGPLVKDEVSSYLKRSNRPVWLCFALTHDRFEPIKRLLCRSDWPLESRIVAPTSGRIQYLKLTSRLCELAMEAEKVAVDSMMLKIIAADHARDLPGVKVKRGEFHLEAWRDATMEILTQLEKRDLELRQDAADRLKKKREFHQLFGVPDLVNLEPGQSQEASKR